MPIKWSAVKVSQVCNDIEAQLTLAESFFAEAKTLAEEARKLPNLPQYIDQRLNGIADELGYRIDSLRKRVDSIRKDIPDGAVEAEQNRLKHGTTAELM